MSKYTMNTANAVFFLNLWEPHANYFYQAGEAKAWAVTLGMRRCLRRQRRCPARYYT